MLRHRLHRVRALDNVLVRLRFAVFVQPAVKPIAVGVAALAHFAPLRCCQRHAIIVKILNISGTIFHFILLGENPPNELTVLVLRIAGTTQDGLGSG